MLTGDEELTSLAEVEKEREESVPQKAAGSTHTQGRGISGVTR